MSAPAPINMNIVKNEKRILKQALKDMTEFHANTIQFRKTYYVVSVYFKVPHYITVCGRHVSHENMTRGQQNRVEEMIRGLALHYPVKIISDGNVPNLTVSLVWDEASNKFIPIGERV